MSRRQPGGAASSGRAGSSRPIPAPPRGRSGPIAAFHRFLYGLYLDADTPTLLALDQRVRDDDELPGAPARASIGRIFDWDTVPTNRRDLIAVVTVLARLADVDEHAAREQAVELWTKARYAPAPVVLGQPIADIVTDPEMATERFSVHPAIEVEPGSGGSDTSLPELPLYVPRAHDDRIAELIRQAEDTGRPRAVVLVGGSSTGKTRACWEALHQLVTASGGEADGSLVWRVWRPVTPTKLATGLTGGADHPGRRDGDLAERAATVRPAGGHACRRGRRRRAVGAPRSGRHRPGGRPGHDLA